MRIIDRVSAPTRRRIEAAQARFAEDQTMARWDEFRIVMVDAEREVSDWVPGDRPCERLTPHNFMPRA